MATPPNDKDPQTPPAAAPAYRLGKLAETAQTTLDAIEREGASRESTIALVRLAEQIEAMAAEVRTLATETAEARKESLRFRALLERVRHYAVVDPLGDPAASSSPPFTRMAGIESDIDDALAGKPISARELDGAARHYGWRTPRN